jgi:DHA1 family bicyclomycin/chloramphenicol resistance-like MFS transporter
MQLLLLVLLSIASALELEMSIPSFVDIANFFNASEEMMGFTISINVIAFAVTSFLYGPLTDVYGRKKVLVLGNIAMSIGAIGCVFSQSITMLLVSRFIQGLGAASSVVIVPIIVSEIYKGDQSSKVFNIIVGCTTVFTAIAPILGGFINYSLGWRWNYGVMAIISVIVTLLLIFLKETKKDEKSSFNFIKILKDYKLVIFSLKFFSASSICNLLYGLYVAFIAYSAFLYMKVFGLTEIQYSLHQGFVVCASAIMSFSIGLSKAKELNIKLLLFIASILIIFGSCIIMISRISYLTTLGMSIFILGETLSFSLVFSYSMQIFPNLRGVASSVNIGMGSIMFSILVSIATLLYDGSSFKIGLLIFIISMLTISMTYYLNSVKLFDREEKELSK